MLRASYSADVDTFVSMDGDTKRGSRTPQRFTDGVLNFIGLHTTHFQRALNLAFHHF